MQRLTTDSPTSNLSSLLNIAYVGDDERVKLRYADGQEDVDLCEFMAKLIAADSTCLCKPTAEHILDGCCLDCDCEYGYLYAVATQAAELRARLMMIEDILGMEYDLQQLLEAIRAQKGFVTKYLMRPCKNRTVTNADRIRSMNDDELAEFLMRDDICDARMSPTCDKGGCRACVSDWLHQSVKEDTPCTPT